MRLVQSAVFLSLVAAGCGLFKSEPGSPGSYPPVMYGTAPVVAAGSQAGTTGTQDAAAPSTGGSDGSAPGDAIGDVGKPAPDTASHNDDQLWNRFPFSSTRFTKCTWLTQAEGYCNDVPTLVSGSVHVLLFKTLNGGKSWTRVTEIDTEVSDITASINVYVLSQSEFWYIAGSNNAGSIGISIDAGIHWTSLTSDIVSVLTPTPSGDAGATSLPVWQLASYDGKVWIVPQGPNLVIAEGGGVSFKKVTPPPSCGDSAKRALVASQKSLLLPFQTSDGLLSFCRWNGAVFSPTEASLPASSAGSHAGTWSRAWPAVEGMFFADRGPLPAWGSPFWAYATVDGGKSFLKLLPSPTGRNDVFGLSDGVVSMATGTLATYVSGIFTDSAGERFLEIRRSLDAGKTWTPVHSEPSYYGDSSYISLVMDGAGKIHAMHFIASTDGVGPPVTYDAHYVLQ